MTQRAYLPRTFCQRCGMNVPITRTYMRGLPRLFWNLTLIGFFWFRSARWHCTWCGQRVATPGRLLTPEDKLMRSMGRQMGRRMRRTLR